MLRIAKLNEIISVPDFFAEKIENFLNAIKNSTLENKEYAQYFCAT